MTDRFPRPEKALYLVPGMELWEIIGHFFKVVDEPMTFLETGSEPMAKMDWEEEAPIYNYFLVWRHGREAKPSIFDANLIPNKYNDNYVFASREDAKEALEKFKELSKSEEYANR